MDREGGALERLRGYDAGRIISERMRDSVLACGCLVELGDLMDALPGVATIGELGTRCHRTANGASFSAYG